MVARVFVDEKVVRYGSIHIENLVRMMVKTRSCGMGRLCYGMLSILLFIGSYGAASEKTKGESVMKKTILICGGAGYIGSHTAYLLAQSGHEIIIIDTYIHGQHFKPSWAKVIKKDFADQATLADIFQNNKIDAVMHFAGFFAVGESVRHPQKYYENNVIKTAQLLDTMLRFGVKKFIFSSSCAVYGTPVQIPIPEDHPKNPINPYGKTKLAVEFILEDYATAYGLEYVSLRYFNAAGALPEAGLGEQHKPETHVLPRMLQAVQMKTLFSVFGRDYDTKDGTCVRDYLHVQDIAKAHVLALDHLDRTHTSDCFNLGTGHGYSVQELIDAVEKVSGSKMVVKTADRRPGDPKMLVADSSKANSILGWRPEYSDLEYILKSALRWEVVRHELDAQAAEKSTVVFSS